MQQEISELKEVRSQPLRVLLADAGSAARSFFAMYRAIYAIHALLKTPTRSVRAI